MERLTADDKKMEESSKTPEHSPLEQWSAIQKFDMMVEENQGKNFLDDMIAEFPASPSLTFYTPQQQLPQKFDLSIVTEDVSEIGSSGQSSGLLHQLESRMFNERDFQSHRTEDFPQTHQPLRPILLSRSTKKKAGPSTSSDSSSYQTPIKSNVVKITSKPIIKIGKDKVDMGREVPTTETIISLHPIATGNLINVGSGGFNELIEHPLKKVQFEIGGAPITMDEVVIEKRKYKVPKFEDPQERLIRGDQRDCVEIPLLKSTTDLTDLTEVDKEDLSIHRFEDTKGFRRHKFHPNKSTLSSPEEEAFLRTNKYDHEPHEIFVELDILSGIGEGREWKESARWIKYEEDLEEGADRWGKPHVASLSFHSLINLRRLLETGVVLLDLEERDLPGVAYRVVEQMGMNEMILSEEKALVLRSLLLKHKHVNNESGKVWNYAMRKGPGSHSSLQAVFEGNNGSSKLHHQTSLPAHMCEGASAAGRELHFSTQSTTRRRNSNCSTSSRLDNMNKLGLSLSTEDLKWIEKESTLMRQIPTNAEATIVLVGHDDSLQGVTIAFVRLAESVFMPNITEVPIPVRFVFILLGPSNCDLDYKEIGRSISTLMCNREFHDIAYSASERRDLLKGINEFLDLCIVLPHGDWDDHLFPFNDLCEKSREIERRKHQVGNLSPPSSDVLDSPHKSPFEQNPFKRTGRLFGGMVNDVRRRYRLYGSDIRDGLNVQCLATIIFLYFACVSGAIAFGGLMQAKTSDYIGIPETLLGTAIGGVLFAVFSGQPLLIVGTTGPALVFDESLFNFCSSSGMDGSQTLAVRSWIGVWLLIIGLAVACFEGSVTVRFFTRFTQEVFAVLISFVFIYESFMSLLKVYRAHPLTDEYAKGPKDPQPNVALLCTILMIGTFTIAYFFKEFKNGTYLNKSLRKTIGNFAVIIAIVFMSLLDKFIQHPETEKLNIPDASNGLKNTDPSKRDWLIDPLSIPIYWIYAAAIPALLLYILIFMETSIAELIVGKKEMRLKKGSGFHLDILILCFINMIMGFLGTCWISAATVRCVTHLVALTVYSTNNPPGEKPVIIGVKEQRVTALSVSILLGFSVLMGSVLQLIPMAVISGVFLFMGISSMTGIQFLDRTKLLFKQTENYPEIDYAKRTRTWKMHLFTFIQIICLALLWGVKESPAALILPLVIILLVPFRFIILPLWFTQPELNLLDSGGDKKDSKVKPSSNNKSFYKKVFGQRKDEQTNNAKKSLSNGNDKINKNLGMSQNGKDIFGREWTKEEGTNGLKNSTA